MAAVLKAQKVVFPCGGEFYCRANRLARKNPTCDGEIDLTVNRSKRTAFQFFLRQAPVVNLMSLNVKTESFGVISFPPEMNMDLQIKLFRGLDRGNHVIVITRGLVDLEGLRQIFRNIVDTTRSLLDCRVLVDLQDATYCLEPGELHEFAVNLRPEFWPPTNRVALVSVPEPQDYCRLCLLSTFLSNRRIRNAVFKDTRSALSWLVEAT